MGVERPLFFLFPPSVSVSVTHLRNIFSCVIIHYILASGSLSTNVCVRLLQVKMLHCAILFSILILRVDIVHCTYGNLTRGSGSKANTDLLPSETRGFVFPDVSSSSAEGRGRFAKSECDAHIREREGWIFTANYPSNYDNNRACYYVIERYTQDTCKIEMTINDFDLEESDNCLTDYLDLRDGQQEVLCGNLASGTKKTLYFRSGQSSMTLLFRSNDRNTYKGFMIQLKQIPRSCEAHRAMTRTNFCNQYVDTFTATITSPGYPHGYSPKLRCAYTIRKADPRICKVLLEFRILDFGYGSNWPCHGDYLEFPDETKICEFRSARKTLDFPRGSDLLTFYFVSNNQGSGKGFDIEILQVPDSCGIPPIPPPTSGAQCDQEIAVITGQFTSPGYPGPYGANERCRYTVHKVDPSVCSIELDFKPFDVEYSGSDCTKDYLALPNHSRLCGLISGKRLVDVPEDRDSMNMYFVSDERRGGRGFRIFVTQLLNTCSGTGRAGFCDQEITGYTGTFTSPGYPTAYPSNQRCTYTVRRADPTVCAAEIAFVKFDLEHSGDNCFKDFLMLPNRTRMCGVSSGAVVLNFPTGSDILALNFVSDQYSSGRGFQLKVNQRKASCGRPPTDCNFEISTATSRITSPGYPGFYRSGLRCQYKIRQPDSSTCVVTLDFRNFNVPASPGCSEDYLELPDKTRLCGPQPATRTLDYSSLGTQSLNLNFVTDSVRAGKGFDIVIRQLPNSCGKHHNLHSSTQAPPCDIFTDKEVAILNSPGYPQDYPPNAVCVYTVKKYNQYVCQVELEFTDFDIEDGPNCESDYLLIESTEERLCGSSLLPKKAISFKPDSDNLRMVFASDLATQRKGFQVKLRQIRNSCFRPVGPSENICGRYTQLNGYIQSQNFPQPYLPNTDCMYEIVKASANICQLELYFSHFEVASDKSASCDRDFLEVKGAKYCGKRDGQRVVVDFPPSEKELKLHFKTDSYEQQSGFRIEFKQLTSGCGPAVNRNCDQTFAQQTFQIISPGYQTGSYPENTECKYTIKKSSFKVCALQVKFYTFDIEESEDCNKDYLKILDQKLCGRMQYDSVRTYEFLADETAVIFHSDSRKNGAGFFLLFEQIDC